MAHVNQHLTAGFAADLGAIAQRVAREHPEIDLAKPDEHVILPDVIAKEPLGTRTFQVEIAKECAGYEGIGLMWVTLGAYLWVFRARLRFPHALLLLPIGTTGFPSLGPLFKFCDQPDKLLGSQPIGL